MNQMSESALDAWSNRQALAEAMIPMIGRLYRENNVVTSIHGRSEARTYAKSVAGWSCEQQLSPEEEEAIEHARP